MRHIQLRGFALAGIALGLIVGSVQADVVTLTDGSRLVGKVSRLSEGSLIFESPIMGSLLIEASAIVSLETDEPLNIGLETGDRLVGKIVPGADGAPSKVDTELGAVPIELNRIDAIWQPGEKSPEVLAAEAQLQQVIEETQKSLDAWRPKWAFKAQAGYTLNAGNTNNSQLTARVDLKRKGKKDEFGVFLYGQYAEQEQVRSASEVQVGANYRYNFEQILDGRLFIFAESLLEYDEFENIQLRAIASAGPGYRWLKKDTHNLSTQLGLGFIHESFLDDTPNRNEGLLNVGLDYHVQLWEFLTFDQSTRYYPTFNGLEDYRITADQAIEIPVAASEVWKIRIGALLRYDPIPAPGNKELDTTLYANLVFDLKEK